VSDRLEHIRTVLERTLEPESIDLVDESHLHAGHPGARDGGGHFALTIVAECFRGKSVVARHRMVYDALAAEMGGAIHALGIKAYTPDEI